MHTQTAANSQSIDSLDAIRELLANDLAAMKNLIKQKLNSNIPIIETITHYIIANGGKQIRPILTLLAAKAFRYEGDKHYQLSTVIEFVHTATLLHDDVIDASQLRRGKSTAHEIWGNQASVLVGDFLYSRALQILSQHQNSDSPTVLANAINIMVEGEMNQLISKHNANLNEEDYLQIIQGKTASLFAAASEIGAIAAGASLEQRQALAQYGFAIGTAFQIIDDLLDYTANHEEIGKNIGDDLAEGKVTLPLIYTLQECLPEHRQKIQDIIAHSDTLDLSLIIQTMQATNAIAKTKRKAEQFAEKAAECLQLIPDSIYRQALLQLVNFAINRRY